MSSVKAAISECVDIVLEGNDRATVDDIVSCAWERAADALYEHANELAWRQVRAIVKSIMRERTSDDDQLDQLSIPGLGFPSAIAIPTGANEFEYVRWDKATWDDLVAGREIRVANITNAQRQLDRYDESLERVRPVMEGSALTGGEAWKLLAARR